MLSKVNTWIKAGIKAGITAASFCALMAAPASSFETAATAAVVVDHGTGQVLLSKNADLPLPPASMSKLMTLNMTFEALRDGRLSLDTVLPVSPHASSFGGSTMFLDPRDRVKVEDLIRGIVVLSGNDACVVLAEALSPDGTEAGFARMMTQRARELGMENSTFVNASGWPQPGHVMSMKDLAALADRLITEFPEYYGYFAETRFEFDGRAPANTRNRNPLLQLGIGADGLKTGHTQEAGYGLVGSAVQEDRRVIFVITGLQSEADRAREAERLTNWAFRQFNQDTVITKGETVHEAAVFMGAQDTVPLVTAQDVSLLIPVLGDKDITAKVDIVTPLEAPVSVGTQVGTLTLTVGQMTPVTLPLFTGADVAQAGVLGRIKTSGNALLQRALGGTDDLEDTE